LKNLDGKHPIHHADTIDKKLLLGIICVSWYIGNNITGDPMSEPHPSSAEKIRIERVQTGVRMEKRMLKVLKALAEYLDLSLGDLLEGIVLHAFEGKPSPLNDDLLQRVVALKQVYNMDYDSSAAHNFEERQYQ